MATYYLDFDAGTNGVGSEASPWNSFDTAQNGITRGDTVYVEGKRKGTMVFNPLKGGVTPSTKTKWLGTIENPFIVSGEEDITGWVQCSGADEVDVGSNYAVIWKTTVAKTSFSNSQPFGANVCESHQQIPICLSREDSSDIFFITRPQTFWTASDVVLSGANLQQVKLASVTDLYTELQLERASIFFTASPNIPAYSKVGSFNPATKFITLASPAPYEDNEYKDNFAIANLIPAMKRGEWGYIDHGTTVTMYIWPQNVLSLAGDITYSARTVGININGTSNIEVAYFKTRQTSGAIGASGNLFNSGTGCTDVHLHNFESTDMADYGPSNGTSGAFAPIYLSGVDNLTMHHFDVRRAQGLFGIYLQGQSPVSNTQTNPNNVNLMSGGYVHHFTVAYASSAGCRMFVTGNHVVAFGIFWECGKQSHGNKMNAYQSSYNHLWWGIDAEDADGYFTWQEMDSLVMAFCSSSASRAANGGARGIIHQQGSRAKQGSVYGWKGSALFNCSTTPNGIDGRLGSTNSIRPGSGVVPLDRWNVWNNIYHGHSGMTASDLSTIIDWDYNITTAGVGRGANDQVVTLGATYVNAAIDDFRYTAGALIRSKVAKNLASYVADLQVRFPRFTDWDKDMVGDTFTWSNIGIGPTKNKDAPRGAARNITYAGIASGSDGGGGGEPSRPVFSPGFKIALV